MCELSSPGVDVRDMTAFHVLLRGRGASPFVAAAFPFPFPLSSAVRSLSSGDIVESSFSSRGPMLVTLRR